MDRCLCRGSVPLPVVVRRYVSKVCCDPQNRENDFVRFFQGEGVAPIVQILEMEGKRNKTRCPGLEVAVQIGVELPYLLRPKAYQLCYEKHYGVHTS